LHENHPHQAATLPNHQPVPLPAAKDLMFTSSFKAHHNRNHIYFFLLFTYCKCMRLLLGQMELLNGCLHKKTVHKLIRKLWKITYTGYL